MYRPSLTRTALRLVTQHQPRPPSTRRGVSDMEAHIVTVCSEHGIELSGSSQRGRAIRWKGGRTAIAIPEIRGQVSYFVALHEIGHLIGPGRSAPRLESEANAWMWALANSRFEPTAATRRSISKRLNSYLLWARNRQHRKHPPRFPPPDHVFWDLVEGRFPGRSAA